MKSRFFVLGLDGARLEFLNRPELPTFQKIINNGHSGELVSRPALTPAAWTSMVTGKNPGKHGIFDFRIKDELLFATDKKSKEIWDYIPAVVVNVPVTYPAKPIDGVMVSGMMSPDLNSDLTYPEEEKNYLQELDYIIEPEHDLDIIRDSIKKRIKIIKHYFNNDWRLFFIVFREFDVLHHFFWGKDLEFYKIIDDFLADYLLPELNSINSSLAIVSDHGFTSVDKAVNVDVLLKKLELDNYFIQGGWGALYATEKSSSKIVKQAIDKLKSFSLEGQRILKIYKKNQLYWGPEAYRAPDLLVWPKRELGYTFKMKGDSLISSSKPKNGCHLEEGVVVLYGQSFKTKKIKADIKDIFPTIMNELGLSADKGVDGKIIK